VKQREQSQGAGRASEGLRAARQLSPRLRLRGAKLRQIASKKPKHECTTNQEYPQTRQEHEVIAKGADKRFHPCCL
jgi:hypothetical protein